jgi:hypothetical protein
MQSAGKEVAINNVRNHAARPKMPILGISCTGISPVLCFQARSPRFGQCRDLDVRKKSLHP